LVWAQHSSAKAVALVMQCVELPTAQDSSQAVAQIGLSESVLDALGDWERVSIPNQFFIDAAPQLFRHHSIWF
jgi:hypothetical protein